MLLHEFGSNNPLGVSFRCDGIPMGPYYITKDLNGINFLFIIYKIYSPI